MPPNASCRRWNSAEVLGLGFLAFRRTSAHSGGTMERRRDARSKIEVFANRYIDGHPFAVELLDASASGFRVRTLLSPDTSDCESFPIEVRMDGVRIWAWKRRVWKDGDQEALRIVSADPLESARFRKLLRERAAA